MSTTKLQLIANSYATALLEVAEKNNSADVLYKAFKKHTPFFNQPQVKKVLDNPLLSKNDHESFIQVFGFKGAAQHLMTGMIKTLSSYSRMALLPDVIHSYCNTYMEKNGECEVTLISAKDLGAKQENALKKKLETHLQKKVFFNKKIQESLKAGFVLEFRGNRLDLSLKSQLQQFSNHGMLK